MESERQESWWILRAQAGDQEALNELFKAVQHRLYGYLLSMVGQRTLAEDILQEVFIRLYRDLRWLQEPKMFRPWAYRIASREAFRFLKRERRWSEQIRDEELLAGIPDPVSENDLPGELLEQLPLLLERVSPASRAVLILHYLHDMHLSEVAEVLGISIGTVKSRLAYGLTLLRRAINENQ